MQTRELVRCPICAGALRSLEIAEDYNVRALCTQVTIEFAICAVCGFVCQSRALALDDLLRYYQESPKLREAEPSATDRSLHAAQVLFMRSAGELRGRRVLDIGADMGKLLDHLLTHEQCETYFEEQNRTAKDWLQRSNRHTDAADLAPGTSYDWIVLSQVLEHIVDPVPALAGLRGRLGNDGKVFIEVPHHGAWDELDLGFFFEHVNYFSAATLTAALDRAGYNVIRLEVTTDAHYFEGRGRIIRACAQIRPSRLLADAATVVREHDRKHKLQRLDAVSRLCAQYDDAVSGVAVYGAAELTDALLRYLAPSGGCSIRAIFDSDVRKHGLMLGKHVVRPPAEILATNCALIVILSSAEADIRRTIELTGFRGRVVAWSELSDV